MPSMSTTVGATSADRKYTRGRLLGEGTWGLVYLCTRVSDNLNVAIKRIKQSPNDKEGCNFTALREVKYLRELRHENIVDMLDVYVSDACVHLVFEVCATDLEKVIKAREEIFLKPGDIKSYLLMTLLAVQHCHKHFVLHRDLKPSNLLISDRGVLKLTDFGLARTHGSPNKLMTAEVVTNWYRSPELLFGANMYGGGVDVWAIGCIFAELVLRQPLFPGETDLGQLGKIFNTLGTPTEAQWPGLTTLPNYVEFEPRAPVDLNPILGDQTMATKQLLLSMLAMNPLKRCTVDTALGHDYFSAMPLATSPSLLQLPVDGQAVITLEMRTGIASSQTQVKEEMIVIKEETSITTSTTSTTTSSSGHAAKRPRVA
jgi:cyclin-dependent kinase 7